MSKPLQTSDPLAGYQAHAKEIRAAIDHVLASGKYILGPQVEAFEKEFGDYLGHPYSVVGVANGTDALELALREAGVVAGDVVATVANTASATAAAIQQIGARLLFIEIDPATMVMDPSALETALASKNVKAVVPVHLYGHPAPMPAIQKIAMRRGAGTVEDAAQAHGAVVAGKKVGTWGFGGAAFSFYPTKNLGALGDGGAVVARNTKLVRQLSQYGWQRRYVSEIPGCNSRLDEMQAAILRVKLKYLDEENAKRRTLAARYLKQLAGSGLQLPATAPDVEPVWHQFVIRTPRRDALQAHLWSQEIHCGILYPVPLHRQPAYADPTVSLPETERACAELLCLPMHPGLTTGDVDRVCDEILLWARS